MKNIDQIVNINGLMKKCMDSNIRDRDKSLLICYKAKLNFIKYFNSKYKEDLKKVNKTQLAKRIINFVHERRNNVYRMKETPLDITNFSTYEVFRNFECGEEEIGNCLGMTQLMAYLFESFGIETFLSRKKYGFCHYELFLKINGKDIPINVLDKEGFDKQDKKQIKENLEKLESIMYLKHGIAIAEGKNNWELALNYFTKSIELDSTHERAYVERAKIFLDRRNFKESKKDICKSEKLFSKIKKHYNEKTF